MTMRTHNCYRYVAGSKRQLEQLFVHKSLILFAFFRVFCGLTLLFRFHYRAEFADALLVIGKRGN